MGRGRSGAGKGGGGNLIDKIDRVAKRRAELQSLADKIYRIGTEFYNRATGEKVSRRQAEKINNDLKKANKEYEELLKQV